MGTYLIREHGSSGSLQVVEGGNLPHQRAWFFRFPGGGGRELTSSKSMVLQVPFRGGRELTSSEREVPFRWWTYLIREHGSPGSLQVVVGVDDEGRDVEGVAGRDPEAGNVQLCLGVVHELGHDEGSAVGVHRAVQVREPVPLDPCTINKDTFNHLTVRVRDNVTSYFYVSRCVLEPPVLPADLFVPSPGYEVPPDLATVPRPLVYTFCSSRCPQHRFECSE